MIITALLLVLSPIIAILIRIIYLIHQNGKGQTTSKKLHKINAKTLIVLGSGGHTTEMLRIVKHLSPERYSPRIYVHAETDSLSRTKVKDFESQHCDYKVVSIPRSRQVHQSYFSSVWSTFYATLFAVPVVWNEAPDLILCNGPGTCVPLCVIAFVLKVVFLLRSKIIFVESFCRVKSLSLTGKILYFFADNVIVQWPYLGSPQYTRTIVV